jgi:hypothetical protein
VFYEGENLIYTGINTNDTVETALEKIDARFANLIFTVNVIAPLQKTGTVNTIISIPKATSLVDGYLSSTDWSIFNSKQNQLNGIGFVKANGTTITYDNSTYYLASNPNNFIPLTALSSAATGLTYTNTTGVFTLTPGYVIPTTTEQTNWNTAYANRISSLTTTGSSGAATLLANVLNVPNYTLAGLGGVPSTRTLTINGVTFDLSANRTWTIDALPSQTGNSGKYLTTNGTIASWGVISTANLYNSDGTLTANRILSTGIYNLAIQLNTSFLGYNITPTVNIFQVKSSTDENAFSVWNNGSVTIGRNAPPRSTYALVVDNGFNSGIYTGNLYSVTAVSALAGSIVLGQYGTKSIAFNDVASTGSVGYNVIDGLVVSSGQYGGVRYNTTIQNSNGEGIRIFGPTGNVVIGGPTFSDALYKLDVTGAARVSGDMTIGSQLNLITKISYGQGGGNKSLIFYDEVGASKKTGVSYLGNTTSNNAGLLLHTYGSLAGADILFGFGVDATTATLANTKMALFNSTGNLGIGVSSDAGYRLDVNGTARVNGNMSFGTTSQTGINYPFLGKTRFVSASNPFFGGLTAYDFEVWTTAYFEASLIVKNGGGIGTTGSTTRMYFNGNNAYFRLNNGTNDILNVNEAGVLVSLENQGIPTASAILEAKSTTKGFLPPRMTTTQRDAIASPATGLQVYNTTTNTSDYYNGTAWVSISSGNIYTTDGTLTSARTLTSGGFPLTFTGSNTSASAIARGLNLTHTLVASANSDVLVGLDINPTFTNGAFTSVKNYGIRINGGIFQKTYYTDISNVNFLMGSGYELYGLSHASAGYEYYITNSFGWGSGWTLNFGTNTNKILSISSSSVTANPLFTFNSGWTYGQLSTFNSSPSVGFTFSEFSGWNFVIRNTTGTNRFRVFNSTGNIGINTDTDNGYRLDVNGTARVSDNLTVSKNQNAATLLTISNTTSGNASQAAIGLTSDSTSGSAYFGKYSNTKTVYKIFNTNDFYFTNDSRGDIAILNDFATGKIKFSAGGSSTAQITLTSAGRLLIGTTTEDSYIVDGNGRGRFTGLMVGNTTTASESAALQADSTTRGFLPPRMTTVQRDAIASPATGLQVYNTTTNTNDYYNGTSWSSLAAGNIYTTNGTLTGNRTVSLNNNLLLFNGGEVRIAGSTSVIGNSGSLMIGNPANNGALSFAFSSIYFNGANGYHFSIATGLNDATATTFLQVRNSGNVLINTTSDAGFKLDVNGTARVSGTLTCSSGTFLQTLGSTATWFSDGNNPLRVSRTFTLLNLDNVGNFTTLSSLSSQRVICDLNLDSSGVYTGVLTGLVNSTNRNMANLNRQILQLTTIGGGSVINAPKISFLDISKGNVTGFTTYIGIDVIDCEVRLNSTSGSTIVGGSSINASAKLQVDSTTQGFLPPRMTTTQKNAIVTPATGLQVYDATLNVPSYYNGTAWVDSGANIYNSNGTLSGNRTVTMAGNSINFSGGNIGIGGAPAVISSLQVITPNQWSGAFVGNMGGARTPSQTYGIHLGWNYTGGSGESNIVWGTVTGASVPNPHLVFSTWDGTTKTDRVEFQDTGKVVFKNYQTATSFTGTAVGHLAFDLSGNVITVPVPSSTNIYNSNGVLDADRTVGTTTGFKLIFNPKLEVATTTYNPTSTMLGWSAVNGYVQTTIPASTSFTSIGYAFSSLIGNNYMTYAGSASFAADIFTGAVVGINNFQFTAAASTITINQSSSIRTYSAGLYQNTTSGSINGTVTHLSGLAVRPIFRASGTSTITVTNNYGLLIADQNEYNHATITNRWGIYQEGVSDINYFHSKLLIGSATDIPSAKVVIDSTAQGVLVPRMTTTQINAITSPADGLLVYNTTISSMCCYLGSSWRKFNDSPM